MDSRQKFLEIIRQEYSALTFGKVEDELLEAVSAGVTDYYYEQYQRFRKQYPNSVKRYSSFDLKDLNHPLTHELILKIVKEKTGAKYENPATIFLNTSLDELKGFEKSRKEFYEMF